MSITLYDDYFSFTSNTYTSTIGPYLGTVGYKVPNTNLTVANCFSVLGYATFLVIGGNPSVTVSENVQSITDEGTGSYRLVFLQEVPASGSTGLYGVSGIHSAVSSGVSAVRPNIYFANSTGFSFETRSGSVLTDPYTVHVIAYGS